MINKQNNIILKDDTLQQSSHANMLHLTLNEFCMNIVKYNAQYYIISQQYTMKSYSILLSVIFILPTVLSISLNDNPVITYEINSDWQFQITSVNKQEDPSQNQQDLLNKKLTTQIPSNLYLDFMKNKDKFEFDIAKYFQKISYCTVKYIKKFRVQQYNSNRASQLILHGINTFANVILNGHLLLQTQNSFRKYVIRIEKYLLKNSQNILVIQIQPTYKHQDSKVNKNKPRQSHLYVRQPFYPYQSNWLQNLKMIGIWKPVQLRFFDHVRFDYIMVRNRQIKQQKVTLNFAVKMQLNIPQNAKIKSYLYRVQVYSKSQKIAEKYISQDTAYLNVQIKNPSFWWPNRIGEPFMYDFQVYLLRDSTKIDNKRIPYGIRTTDLVTQDDKFIVKINGYEVYCKGANYLPMDLFYPRTINQYFQQIDAYSYEQLLNDVADSNLNMIRVWGGGAYQSQQFFQIASRKGIMIIYDFMLTQNKYPISPQFLENIEQQIKQQIRKIRNYPSLILWNANSKQKIMKTDEQQIILFEKLIRRIVTIQSPQINYVYSYMIERLNVKYLGNRNEDLQLQNFAISQNSTGPYHAQFGLKTLPVWQSIRQLTKKSQRQKILKLYELYGSYSNLQTIIQKYRSKYIGNQTNSQKQAYLISLIQALQIQNAIANRRSSKSHSYGLLFKQLNDFQPTISYSSIDYYGRWKPLQYIYKRLCTGIAVFVNQNYQVVAINNNLYKIDVTIKILVLFFNGTSIIKEERKLGLQKNQVKLIYQIDKTKIQTVKNQVVAYCEVYYGNSIQMRASKFFGELKDLSLPKSKLLVKFMMQQNKIRLKSRKLTKNLFIDHRHFYIKLSDNYFDIIPNQQVIVQLQNGLSLGDIKDNLVFMSVRQALKQDQILQVQIQ